MHVSSLARSRARAICWTHRVVEGWRVPYRPSDLFFMSPQIRLAIARKKGLLKRKTGNIDGPHGSNETEQSGFSRAFQVGNLSHNKETARVLG